MRPLAVAIIGCGRMGRERARCARQLGHRVLYVVDTNHARALELAVEYDARVLPGASECFAAGVDLVFLCTPAGSRGSLLEQCLQHKVPFLVEKPIGVSGVPYAELANRLSSSRLIHAVGFMNRYRRSVQWAKALLAHRNLLALQAHWICGPYRVPWVNDETLSGGPYNDQAIHAIDLSRFFAGPVTEVQAAFQTPERAATILTFESGVVATLVFSCQAQAKTIGLQIFTREGTIRFEGWNFGLAHNSVDGTLPEDGDEDIFLTETEAFLHAVQSGDTTGLYSNAQDALATQLVIDAARQSHASGQRVKVPQFLPQQEDLLYVAG